MYDLSTTGGLKDFEGDFLLAEGSTEVCVFVIGFKK